MRLRSLLIPVFFPFAALAQSDAPTPKPASHTELAFNLGHALDNVAQPFGPGGYLRGSLSVLKSKGHFQYGLTAEGGTNSWDEWYVTPGAVANYRSSAARSYWYGGAMAGYMCSGEMVASPMTKYKLVHGYVFGLQAGYVRQLGKRLSLSGEIGVRSSQSFHRYDEFVFTSPWQQTPDEVKKVTEARTSIYMPLMIGIRYRLGK